MSHGRFNKEFLNKIDDRSKNDILNSIAVHYGCSIEDVWDEVTHDEAEYLLDYMVEPHRMGTSALMHRYGYR